VRVEHAATISQVERQANPMHLKTRAIYQLMQVLNGESILPL
jgi:hypothetical protein